MYPDSQSDMELHKEYAELAIEMGCEYYLLDGGWPEGNAELPKFIQSCNEKGLKIILWCNALSAFAKGNVDVLTYKLDLWKSWGISGIKIDFFDGQETKDPIFWGEDVDTIKWYETIYQECAKRQLLVNCHGANKPTGERRVYPNVIGREAIYGGEKQSVVGAYNVNALFTRNVIGPTDFTPHTLSFNLDVSVGYNMALAVLYECGSPSIGDKPSVLRDNMFNDFYKNLPAVRNETVFLGGSPDQYYCAAIRSGDDWYVAGITGWIDSDIEVDFSFLDEGTYSAVIYTDNEDAERYTTIHREMGEFVKTDKKVFPVKSECGFVLHLKKQI